MAKHMTEKQQAEREALLMIRGLLATDGHSYNKGTSLADKNGTPYIDRQPFLERLTAEGIEFQPVNILLNHGYFYPVLKNFLGDAPPPSVVIKTKEDVEIAQFGPNSENQLSHHTLENIFESLPEYLLHPDSLQLKRVHERYGKLDLGRGQEAGHGYELAIFLHTLGDNRTLEQITEGYHGRRGYELNFTPEITPRWTQPPDNYIGDLKLSLRVCVAPDAF